MFILVWCVFVFGAVCAGKIPGYLTICSRNNPSLSKCLISAAHAAKPFIGKGIREMGIPALAPFTLPQVTFEQGTQAVNYKANLTNIRLDGLNNYHFQNLSFDTTKLSLYGTVKFDKIDVTANYDVTGKILVAPIKGVGKLTVNTGPTTATFDLAGKINQNDKHIVPTKVKVKIDVSTGKANFNGIINNNEELSIATNRILNENARELLRDAVPALERISGEVLSQIWGTINRIISYDELLPPS